MKNGENSQVNILVQRNDLSSRNMTLGRVFNEIRSYGLNLKRVKFQTAVNQLLFLQHILSNKGVKPDPKKVEAILDLL